MKLYLIRHGEAVSEKVDATRPLSSIGKEEISKLAKFIEKVGIEAKVIYHSGKKRALQTAEIVQKAMKTKSPLKAKDCLGPNDPIDKIYQEITKLTEDCMLIGHLPFLGRLASQLILGNPHQEIVAFRTGTMVVLEKKSDGPWQMAFSISPKQIQS